MATRKTPQPPLIQQKVFTSVEEIDAGIKKLHRRITELETLDQEKVLYGDQRIYNAASNIQNTILEVFGQNSREFQDHRYHRIWDGAEVVDTSDWERQKGFANGIPKSKTVLEGLISRLEEKKLDFSPSPTQKTPPQGEGIFLVHGRNESFRETVARFLERLGLNVIIFHERPDRSRTIIEKFEEESKEAGFAVVLLTADDRGGLKEEDPQSYKLRARQNVLFELGFFLGALGRNRVCALYEEGVDIPSDYQGVLFVKLDADWRLKLARELKEAHLPVDLNKAF